MKFELYQVDAFTDKVFGGNSACVVPLEKWLPDDLLFKIAKENAVAETAYFIKNGNNFDLRWFTPDVEMDLCGHATLATAHVLKAHLNYNKSKIVFHSKSGDLEVSIDKDVYTLNFPSRKPFPVALPEIIKNSVDRQPKEVLKSRDYVLVYESEQDIKNIKIDRQVIGQINLDTGGVVITSKGDNCDFVSRHFSPQGSLFEDPVTGSAHCSLIPYWSERLGKKEMKAMQLSDRIGKLFCVNNNDRVLISGQAKTYSVGQFWVE